MNTLINELLRSGLTERVGWALVHFIWQGAAVALLLAVALRLLSRQSPQLRWAVACLALLMMAALPVVTAMLVSGEPPASVAMTAPTARFASGDLPAPYPSPTGSAPPALSTPQVPVAHDHIAATVAVPMKASLMQQAREAIKPLLPWGLLAWLVGVVLLSLWHVGGWLLLVRARRLGTGKAPEHVNELLLNLLARLRVRGRIVLLQSARVAVPVVVGWIKPVILLPMTALTGLSSEQLQAVLAHEIAHIRRLDYLVNLVLAMVETLLFYHPAVWWICSRIRQESENCCDEFAVKVCGDRHGYAAALARVAELCGGKPSLAAAVSGGLLLPRIRRLLGLPQHDHRGRVGWWAGAVILASLLIAGLAVQCGGQSSKDAAANRPGSATQPATQPASRPGPTEGVVGLVRNPVPEVKLTPQQEQRVRELIYVLRNCLSSSREDQWAAAIQELVEIGPGAVPELAAELERTDRDPTMRAVAYTLRVIGDPRAVPALIGLIRKAPAASSDLGLAVTDKKVHAFMSATGIGRGEAFPSMIFNRAVRQAAAGLERITGHSEGTEYLGGPAGEVTPEWIAGVTKTRQEAADRWQAWWDPNWPKFMTAQERDSMALPAGRGDMVEAAGVAKFGPVFPSGKNVKLGPVVEVFLPMQAEAQGAKAFLDLDTGRQLKAYEGYTPTGNRYDPTIWDAQAGVDAQIRTFILGEKRIPVLNIVKKGQRFHVLWGDGTHVWTVDNSRWDSLEKELRDGGVNPGLPEGEAFIPKGNSENVNTPLPWTFLFTTASGGRGILQALESSNNPEGLRLRYRLVQNEATQPATQPAQKGESATAPAGNLACPLEATIYELRLPREKTSQLDAAALTSAAASPEEFDKALASLGQAKALYRMDQSVNLSGDRITVHETVPVVIGSRLTDTGGKVDTVVYQAVGVDLNVAGEPQPGGDLSARVDLELSALTDNPAKVAPNMSFPVTRKVVMGHNGPMTPGKPAVIVSAATGSLDSNGKGVAYVARIVLGKPVFMANLPAPAPQTQPAAGRTRARSQSTQPATYPAAQPATRRASRRAVPEGQLKAGKELSARWEVPEIRFPNVSANGKFFADCLGVQETTIGAPSVYGSRLALADADGDILWERSGDILLGGNLVVGDAGMVAVAVRMRGEPASQPASAPFGGMLLPTDKPSISLFDIAGKQIARIPLGKAGEFYSTPYVLWGDFSPDGKRFCFTVAPFKDERELVCVESAGGKELWRRTLWKDDGAAAGKRIFVQARGDTVAAFARVIDSPFIVYDASGKEIQAGRTQRNEYLEFKDGQWKLSTRGTSMPASSTLSATSRPAAQPAVP